MFIVNDPPFFIIIMKNVAKLTLKCNIMCSHLGNAAA